MSSIGAVPNTALAAIGRETARLETTARRIARDAPLDGDLPRDLVELTTIKHSIAANVRVVQAADEILTDLLDTLA